jgi:filamentous hemagglutinin
MNTNLESQVVKTRVVRRGAQKSPENSLTPIAYAVATALLSLSGSGANAQALPAGATVVQGAKAPVVSVNQQTMTIEQTAPRAIINWNSFNIGAGNRVQFNQQGRADWAVLNRVVGTERSVINGVLQADGQVYLLNNNGILIGKGAQINVHTFLASTLVMSDKVFRDGILSLGALQPVLAAGTGSFAPKGNIRIEPGAIVVAKDGGRISFFASGQVYDSNGQVMLDNDGKPVGLVENGGRLMASNGQIILAAGDKVFLRQPSITSSLREEGFTGLVVEVDAGGKVANALLGFIQSKLGNISMVGLTVNQDGRVSATTSVNRNGSIWLMARDNTNQVSVGSATWLAPTRGGQLSLGASSTTDILPDQDSESQTTLDASPFARSQVRLEGQSIHLQGAGNQGASVLAPNANVYVRARTNPSDDTPPPLPAVGDKYPASDAAVVLDKNSRIDVSGLRGKVDADGNLTTNGVPVAIERNSIRIELRGEQLADAPVLRDSLIRSQAIYVDARVGTPLINQQTLTEAISSQTSRGIYERMTQGGTVSLNSTGTVAMLPGSTVALRGGSVAYAPGSVRTSRLYDGSNYYAIATAPNDRRYLSISDVLKIPEKGYVEGQSAGKLDITTRNLLLDGHLVGGTVVGPNQLANAPFRGGLTLGLLNPSDPTDLGLRHGLTLSDQSPAGLGEYLTQNTADWKAKFDVQFGTDNLGRAQNVSPQMLAKSELSSISLVSNGGMQLTEGEPLNFKPGTDLTLASTTPIAVRRSLRSASGQLSIGAENGVSVADNVSLDVSGLWLNESRSFRERNPLTPRQTRAEISADGKIRSFTQGGAVRFVQFQASNQLATSRVNFGSRTTVDTSSGVYIGTNDKVNGGQGGQFISEADSLSVSSGSALPSQLIGYGFGSGSAFTFNAPVLSLGSYIEPNGGAFNLERIVDAGFSTIKLGSISGNFTLTSGYRFAPRLPQYELPNTTFDTADAALRSQAKRVTLDASRATPFALGLSGTNVQVQSDVAVNLPVGGRLSMTGTLGVSVEGSLSAPSGEISLSSTPANNVGYQPEAGVRIASGASLDVSGVAVPRSGINPANLGDVRAGGTINLVAGGVSGVVQFDEGAKISINGSSANFDVAYKEGAATRYKPMLIASDAGSLNVTSTQGGLFAGSVSAAAGGAGRSYGKLAFNFSNYGISNDPVEDFRGNPSTPVFFPLAEQQFVLASAALAKPSGYSPYGDWDVLVNGVRPVSDLLSAASRAAFAQRISQWRISGASLRDAGNLSFVSGDVVRFVGLNELTARESIAIRAPLIRTDAAQNIAVSAPFIRIGSDQAAKGGQPALANSGTLSFNASLGMDLESSFNVQGANRVTLNSSGSIRLLGGAGADTSGYAEGSFQVPGNLSLVASIVFPISRTRFSLNAPDGDISFSRPAGVSALTGADVPYSALGRLSVSARNIDQAGAIYAPFGQIDLNAQQQVHFAPDSVTSVSGSGVQIPLGTISNGVDWVVAANSLQNPAKSISVTAPTIVIDGTGFGKAARIDSSGGGEIVATEFVKGPQGSTDILSLAGNFAVLPTYSAALAPNVSGESSDIARGATIRFENGIAGLPAGLYRILPASYAQLEGAFLVRPTSGATLGSAIAGSDTSVSRSGVSSLIGYRARETLGVTSQKPEWFEVLSAAQVRERAEYRSNTASSFFANEAASRVQDAGTVKLAVQRALDISGTVDLGFDPLALPAAQARRGTLEVTGNNIRIAAAAVPTSAQNGTAVLSQAKLDEIAPGDLHLGANVTGNSLLTHANTVTVDPNVTLKAGTVILSANDTITLGTGAKVEATGVNARQASTESRVLNVSRATASADSSGSTLVASVQSTTLTRSGSVLTTGPQLSLEPLSVVSGLSVVVDTTGALQVDPSAQVLGSTDTKIGTQAIVVGQAPSSAPGFRLTGNLLNALSQSKSISLQGYQKIVTYDIQSLGGTQTERLRLDTPTLAAGAPGSTLTLSANRVDWLRSSAGSTPTPGAALAGSQLTINTTGSKSTDGLTIGVGDKSVDGFADVAFNVGSGTEGSRLSFEAKSALSIGGNLVAKVDQVQSGLIVDKAVVLADANVAVAGTATFSRKTGQTPSEANEGAGGRIAISASSLSFDSIAKIPSGEIALTSTSGNLTLGSQAVLNVAGYQSPIFDQRIELAGGKVSLNAAVTGATLKVADGAVIDVSAGKNTAGTVELRSRGALDLGRTSALRGASALTHRGGALLVDAQQGVDLDQIAQASVTGQFDRSLDIRARSGDLKLSQGSSIKTETVVVAADNGKMDIEGSIDASSAAGGSVALWQRGTSGQVLTMRDSAKINVSGETGGEVTIGSSNGIVVSGKPQVIGGSADARRAGTLTLRAPRTGPGVSGTGMALSSALPGDAIQVNGRVETSLEGVRNNLTFASTLQSATGASVIASDVAAYQANAASILSRAPVQSNGVVQVLAGVELVGAAGANLTSNAANLDFAASNIGLGSLTVRSNGDLNIAGSISDGVAGGTATATTLARNSWSYRLAAGADLAAANPLAVLGNTALGTLRIAANKDVRTGTGSIGLAASGQVVFEPSTTANAPNPSQPGSVYTVGRLAGANDGYDVAPGYFNALPRTVARTQGGSVTVRAGGTVVGNEMLTSPVTWFLRQGVIDSTTGQYRTVAAWNPEIGPLAAQGTTPALTPGFNMHLGSLAGGKLTVDAQGTENLYLANVSTGRVRSSTPDASKLEIINRAPTTVTVAGDIVGGQFMTMDGELSLTAGQSIRAQLGRDAPVLLHGNAGITANARSSIDVSRPYNPTLLYNATAPTQPVPVTFSTFGDRSLASLASVGEVTVTPAPSRNSRITAALSSGNGADYPKLTTPNWMVQSATNIRLSGFLLAPSDDRHFTLLAGQNVRSITTPLTDTSTINIDPASISFLSPILMAGGVFPTLRTGRRLPELENSTREPVRIYAGAGDIAPSPELTDVNPTIQFTFGQPVWLRAGRDVRQLVLRAQNGKDSDETLVQAGRDIANTVQNVGTSLASNDSTIEISGPGSAVLQAGRDIRFANSRNSTPAFSSIGNAKVTDLPSHGASLVLIAGVQGQPAYDLVLDTYLKPGANGVSFEQSRYLALARQSLTNAGQVADPNATPTTVWNSVQALARPQRDQLARNIFFQELRIAGGPDTAGILRDFVAPAAGTTQSARFSESLIGFLGTKGDQSATAENAWSKFEALPSVNKAEFVSQIALPKLLSDNALSTTDSRVRDYGRGYKAAALLFPKDGAGNIDLVYNSVRSAQGGSVQLLAPGTICRDSNPATCSTPESAYVADAKVGNIRVGLTNPPSSILEPSKLGVFGLGGANVEGFAGKDITVNQSRVVAGGGGDLILWSSGGSIDAGRGSKAAISVPPPTISIDSNGNVVVDLSDAIQGSGIRALSFNDKVPAGEVSLYAPKGTVDAGDAGIQGGNVSIGGAVILNSENIRISSDPNSGAKLGTSIAPVSIAPAPSSSAAAAAATSAVAASTSEQTRKRVRIIVVDFEGFGVDCKQAPNDPSCK